MPVIKPITELRDTNAISEICHKQQQPVFITKNGYGDLVVMSIEAYDELINMNRIDKSILEAEQEAASRTVRCKRGFKSIKEETFWINIL